MKERLSTNTLRGVTAGLSAATAALILSGCGTSTAQEDDKPQCTVQVVNWAPVQGFDSTTIANILGVSQEAVSEGSMGAAQCDPGIPNNQFDKSITISNAPEGLSNECLPIHSEVIDSVGATSINPIVICPASEA